MARSRLSCFHLLLFLVGTSQLGFIETHLCAVSQAGSLLICYFIHSDPPLSVRETGRFTETLTAAARGGHTQQGAVNPKSLHVEITSLPR